MDITPGADVATPKQAHARNESFKHWVEGMHLRFPTFKHDHPAVIDVNKVADEQLTGGQKIADKVASTVGSWRFIIIQSVILTLWIILNIVAWASHWDPYPFILLNLALSFQAAYSAPFVMMSQNRQQDVDRLAAEHDYQINVKAELEIELLHEKIDKLREQEVTQLTQAVADLTEMLRRERGGATS